MSGKATADEPTTGESVELVEAVEVAVEDGFKFGPDKTVPIHIIRPGVGKGKGRHLYEAKMLEENAQKFAGWKMYVDHRSAEAQRAAGGLPRGVRDLGGRVLEAAWDPTVPADPEKGFGQGAVVAKVRPVKWLREMIEDDPELIETSISATATGVRPVKHQGKQVLEVAGINPRGSVDWVTEAGAGGRVAPLIEAAYASEEDVEMALLESMSDDEFLTHMREERPHLKLAEAAEAPGETPPEGEPPAGEEENGEEPSGDGGKPNAETPVAEATTDDPEGGEDMTITPEALREALEQNGEVLEGIVGPLVESRLDEERDLIRAEAKADAQREVQLQKLEVEAEKQIAECALLPAQKTALTEMFSLNEAGEPTAALDVIDEIDEDGAVVKTAKAALKEAIEAEIEKERLKLAEANPTRVRGQGPITPGGERTKRDPKQTGWGRFLQESVGVDPEKAYALNGADASEEE